MNTSGEDGKGRVMMHGMRYVCALISVVVACPAFATFHFMQIEKLIVGVGGDLTAQAIQLRMRTAGQNLVAQSRLVAYDANGENPVVVINIASNVSNGGAGDRILVCTQSFADLTTPTAAPDFLMANTIPAAYRQAGRLTFESDGGTVYWSLSWGGSNYTGPTTGVDNDNNGDFGPSFPEGLPSSPTDPNFARRAVLTYTGTPGSQSTSNSVDYILDAAEPVFTNNSDDTFTLPFGTDVNGDTGVDGNDLDATVDATIAGTPASAADVSADGLFDALDVQLMAAELAGSGAVLGDGTLRGSGVQLVVGNAVAQGGTATVPLQLLRSESATHAPETITATLAYDPGVLDLAGINSGTNLFPWYAKTLDFAQDVPGQVKVTIWNTSFEEITTMDNQRGGNNTFETENPFTLATLLFNVLVKGGTANITVEAFRMADGAGTPFDLAAKEDGQVQLGGAAAEDIDSSGAVDAVDVQLCINSALNIDIGELDADVNGDAAVDAVDVQLVINAALGI